MKLSKFIGLPLDVQEGYAKTIKIAIPWSKLWKDPIEISIEDVYARWTVCSQYNEQFAQEMLVNHISQEVKDIKDEEEGKLT